MSKIVSVSLVAKRDAIRAPGIFRRYRFDDGDYVDVQLNLISHRLHADADLRLWRAADLGLGDLEEREIVAILADQILWSEGGPLSIRWVPHEAADVNETEKQGLDNLDLHISGVDDRDPDAAVAQ